MNSYAQKDKTIGLMPIVLVLSVSFSVGFGILYWVFGKGV